VWSNEEFNGRYASRRIDFGVHYSADGIIDDIRMDFSFLEDVEQLKDTGKILILFFIKWS
jgi:hypothetical protein